MRGRDNGEIVRWNVVMSMVDMCLDVGKVSEKKWIYLERTLVWLLTANHRPLCTKKLFLFYIDNRSQQLWQFPKNLLRASWNEPIELFILNFYGMKLTDFILLLSVEL